MHRCDMLSRLLSVYHSALDDKLLYEGKNGGGDSRVRSALPHATRRVSLHMHGRGLDSAICIHQNKLYGKQSIHVGISNNARFLLRDKDRVHEKITSKHAMNFISSERST